MLPIFDPLKQPIPCFDRVDPNTLPIDAPKRTTKDRQLITGLTVPVNSRALGRLPAREAPTGVVPQEGDPGFEDLKGVPRSRWCLLLKKAQYGLKRSPH